MSLRASLANRANALERHHGAADPRTIEAKREAAAVSIEEFVRKTVDAAPPLTETQRARIASLLRAGGHR